MSRTIRDSSLQPDSVPRGDRVVVSGIKPTGTPHLGNLVGMLRPVARMRGGGDRFCFVADLHALTTRRDAAELRDAVYDAVATLLALGLDPDRVITFRQSDVPEILELSWILGTLAPMPFMERAHAYKAARAEGRTATLGLVSYPVLMAADILSFRGESVPAGSDQAQHVEMARTLARRFNHRFGGDLPLPRSLHETGASSELPGFDGRKMSKQYRNTIPVTATPEERRALVRTIVTDSSPVDAPKNPEASPVTAIFDAFATPEESANLRQALRDGRADWGEAKEALIHVLDREVEPIRERFHSLRSNEQGLEAVLLDGGRTARQRAAATLRGVRSLTGIGPVQHAPVRRPAAAYASGLLDRALEMTFPASDPVAIATPQTRREE